MSLGYAYLSGRAHLEIRTSQLSPRLAFYRTVVPPLPLKPAVAAGACQQNSKSITPLDQSRLLHRDRNRLRVGQRT